MHAGSVARARVEVNGSSDARKLQDEAAEKSSMAYRAPELFNVEAFCHIDERTDVWVIAIHGLFSMIACSCIHHSKLFYMYQLKLTSLIDAAEHIIYYINKLNTEMSFSY